jgi:uncharacterized protein YecE (DUF72 family)
MLAYYLSVMEYYLGTIGFGYTEWLDVLYPRGTKSSEFLSLYSQHFGCVELDTTFYGTPDPARVARWASAVPEDFRFAVKTPRQITHDAPLQHGEAPMRDFLHTLDPLHEKLGPILIQLPPTTAHHDLPHLAKLIATIPQQFHLAIEFRHRSWWSAKTEKLLRDYNVAWVSADYVDEPRTIQVTADFLYLRWIGQHHQFPEMNCEKIDVAPRLHWWKEEIERVTAAHKIREFWGFFNNDYAGYAPATCNKFQSLLNLPIRKPQPTTLFE